jgi:hypothetical protein
MYNIIKILSKWLESHPDIEIKRIHIEKILSNLHYIVTFKDNTYINGHIDSNCNLKETLINTFNIQYKKLKERNSNV